MLSITSCKQTPGPGRPPIYQKGQYVYIYGFYKGRVNSVDTTGVLTKYDILLPWILVNNVVDSEININPDGSKVQVNFQPQVLVDHVQDMDRRKALNDNQQWVNAELYNTDVLIQAAIYEFKNMSPHINYCPKELYDRMVTIDSMLKEDKADLANNLEDGPVDNTGEEDNE